MLPGNFATHLNGSSGRVALGAPASLRPNNFTVEAWFRTSSSAGSQMVYRVRWYGMWLKVGAAGLEGVAFFGNNGSDYRSVFSPQRVNDGRWHHGVLTKDGTSLTLFIDGVQAASVPMTEATYYNPALNTGAAIGRDGDLPGEYFSGAVDEVAVYDHALTAAQVQGHFSLGNPPPTGGAPTLAETSSHANESEPWMCECRGYHADPVDSATGTFAETYTELAVPGRGLPLSFARTYSSARADLDGPLGFGWAHSYAASLAENTSTGTVTITQESGATVTFAASGGSYSAPPRVVASLVKNADGTYTFTRRARELLTFDAGGKLVAIRDLNGSETTLAYVANQLTTVTDPAGRTLTLGYQGGRITTVTDTATPARSVTFSYDGAGNLTDVVDVGDGHSTFGYDAAHRLLTKRAPKYFGDTTTTPAPVTTNHYDGQGRVDWQSDPLGRTTSFDYATVPGATKVIDPKGRATLDRYEHGLLVARTDGYGTSQAATWSFSHDPDTLAPTAVVDPWDGSPPAPTTRPAEMSESDYRSYLSVIESLNRQTCEELKGYLGAVREQAKQAVLDSRIASLENWMRTARAADRSQPSMLGDALHHPRFSFDIFLNATYVGVGCVATGTQGAAVGAVVGSPGGPIGSFVGSAAGAVFGCVAGGVDAYYTSNIVGFG